MERARWWRVGVALRGCISLSSTRVRLIGAGAIAGPAGRMRGGPFVVRNPYPDLWPRDRLRRGFPRGQGSFAGRRLRARRRAAGQARPRHPARRDHGRPALGDEARPQRRLARRSPCSSPRRAQGRALEDRGDRHGAGDRDCRAAPHFDATVDKVLVADGAEVKAGDVLIKLDARQVDAQLAGAEAQLAKDQAQLEQSQRDVDALHRSGRRARRRRQLNLDNAKTAAATRQGRDPRRQGGDRQPARCSSAGTRSPRRFPAASASSPSRKATSPRPATTAPPASSPPSTRSRRSMSPSRSRRRCCRRCARRWRAAPRSWRRRRARSRSSTGKLAHPRQFRRPQRPARSSRAPSSTTPTRRLWPGQLCDLTLTLRIEPEHRRRAARGDPDRPERQLRLHRRRRRRACAARSRSAAPQDGETVVTKGLSGGETVVVDGALLLTEGSKVAKRATPPKGAS